MSQPGDAWKQYYQKGELSWFRPDQVSAKQMLRFSRSEWIRKLVRIMPSGGPGHVRVLEAGCGTGYYALVLGLLGFEVRGFDYNEEALEIALELQEMLKKEMRVPPVSFAREDLLSISEASGSYDFVFNQAVLEYFLDPAERSAAISEMIRVTRPGGVVAAIVQHTRHPFASWWRSIGWKGYVEQPEVLRVTPGFLEQEWKRAGLQDVRTDGIYPWKAFFAGHDWKRSPRPIREGVYLAGEALSRWVPLPRVLRAILGQQILVWGRKPVV